MDKTLSTAQFESFWNRQRSRLVPKTSTAWATGVKSEARSSLGLHEFQSTAPALPRSVGLVFDAIVQRSGDSDVEPIYRRIAKRHLVISSDSLSVENALNAAWLDELRHKFEFILLIALKQEPFEAGVIGQADKIVRTSIERNALATLSWLNDLFLKNYHRPAIAADLLALVSRIPYDIAKPNGVLMAIAGLSHKNEAVQEAAIRSFENWSAPDCLQVLDSVQPSAKWLKDYLADVKRDLKAACDSPC